MASPHDVFFSASRSDEHYSQSKPRLPAFEMDQNASIKNHNNL